MKDVETTCSAYDKETLAIVEVVSRLWRMYLLGCKCFSVVTGHATLAHLLKQPSDKLTDRQSHWVEKLMAYANLMCILCIKDGYRLSIISASESVSVLSVVSV